MYVTNLMKLPLWEFNSIGIEVALTIEKTVQSIRNEARTNTMNNF